MVTISAAATVPINPVGAAPVLTREQVWAGLVIKCRQPQRFIPVMEDCTVESHMADEIVRVVTFKPGFSPLGGDEDVHEVIKLTEGIKADFKMTKNGATVSNVVSGGLEGENDLYMTFTWDFVYPHIADAGSAEAKEEQRKLFEGGLKTVKHTVDVCREFVVKGEVKV